MVRIAYAENQVEMVKSILVQASTTTGQLVQLALCKFHLRGPWQQYQLLLEIPSVHRRILDWDECPLAETRPGSRLSLLRTVEGGAPAGPVNAAQGREGSTSTAGGRLAELRAAQPANSFCADCKRLEPLFLIEGYGILTCAECATRRAFDPLTAIPAIVWPITSSVAIPPDVLEVARVLGNAKAILSPLPFPEAAARGGSAKMTSSSDGLAGRALEQFVDALHQRDLPQIVQALTQGHDPNAAAKHSLPPLHYSALAGDVGLVRLLLAFGADSLKRDAHGLTAHYYARRGGSDQAEGLIKADQWTRAQVRSLRDLRDEHQVREQLTPTMLPTGARPKTVVLDRQRLWRLFLDLGRKVEWRAAATDGTAGERSNRDGQLAGGQGRALATLSEREWAELLSYVHQQQRLCRLIATERALREAGLDQPLPATTADALTAPAWEAGLAAQWAFEASRLQQGGTDTATLSPPEAPPCRAVSSAPSVSLAARTASTPRLGMALATAPVMERLAQIQQCCQPILQGSLDASCKERLAEQIVRYCRLFVQTPGYEPDEECERRLNQLQVAGRKIAEMLEDPADVQRETLGCLQGLREVTMRLDSLLA